MALCLQEAQEDSPRGDGHDRKSTGRWTLRLMPSNETGDMESGEPLPSYSGICDGCVMPDIMAVKGFPSPLPI